MARSSRCVLTINGGSSSIKFAVYHADEPLERLLYGEIDRIGLSGTTLIFNDSAGSRQESRGIEGTDHTSAANFLINWLLQRIDFDSMIAVGHRVVSGGANYSKPQQVTSEMLEELGRISQYDPEHLPSEIEMIGLFRNRFPLLPQIACFDTVFHRDMPRVARLLPIPRRFDAIGIRRYGFHGLSYAYLMEELASLAGEKASKGRVVLAHLGNGASLAAVFDGKSVDTTMGFTPTSGVPMSTRSGDLDPGLIWYLSQAEQMTAKEFHQMVNHQSGLLGVSGISSDMRDLLEREPVDTRAQEAIALFCYEVKKRIGAFAASLGGLDALVFSGGIGENAPAVRARICQGLDFLGIRLDETKNKDNAPVISTEGSPVSVRMIRTDEELMIARITCRILQDVEKNKGANV